MTIKENKAYYINELKTRKTTKSKKTFLTRSLNAVVKELTFINSDNSIYYLGEMKAPQVRELENEKIAIERIKEQL